MILIALKLASLPLVAPFIATPANSFTPSTTPTLTSISTGPPMTEIQPWTKPSPQPSDRPLRIVIPGGSGQVGRPSPVHFQSAGHHVTILTRSPFTAPWQTVHWDGLAEGSWTATLDGADVCTA